MSIDIRRELPERVHVDSVLGKDPSFPRARAISLVPFSKIPHREELLRGVLEDDDEDFQLRRLAAVALWRVNTAEAREALLRAAGTVQDPAALTGVVKSLGRVGDERALAAIRAIQGRSEGTLAAQAAFAAALIAHRLGLPGHDLEVPRTYEEMPDAQQGRIEFTTPPQEAVELFFRCLHEEPYDVDISRDALRQVLCAGAVWMLAFSRTFAAADFDTLRKRKTVAGLLAGKNTENGRYAVAYLLLTAPGQGGDRVDVLVHRPTGERAWAGEITSAGRRAVRFTIHTAGRIGVVPVELDGTWTGNGELAMAKAVSGSRVLEKQHPVRLEGPTL